MLFVKNMDMTMKLPYFAKYKFELSLPDCKVGKDGVYMEVNSLLNKKMVNGTPLFRWHEIHDTGKRIEFGYKDAPFANLFFCEELTITENNICFAYIEKTSQQLMLPNILFFVNMLLIAIKAAEMVNGSFKEHHINCHIIVEHNGDCYFYEKYSPLAVDYSFMLKYGIGKEIDFEFKIESNDDVYVLTNRFYNQFKTSQSVVKPYVTVLKDSFEEVYHEL